MVAARGGSRSCSSSCSRGCSRSGSGSRSARCSASRCGRAGHHLSVVHHPFVVHHLIIIHLLSRRAGREHQRGHEGQRCQVHQSSHKLLRFVFGDPRGARPATLIEMPAHTTMVEVRIVHFSFQLAPRNVGLYERSGSPDLVLLRGAVTTKSAAIRGNVLNHQLHHSWGSKQTGSRAPPSSARFWHSRCSECRA